jgi:hypothetical protein
MLGYTVQYSYPYTSYTVSDDRICGYPDTTCSYKDIPVARIFKYPDTSCTLYTVQTPYMTGYLLTLTPVVQVPEDWIFATRTPV